MKGIEDSSMPSISVVIPAYNAEGTLPKSVESVKAQSFTDFELIIVNDGSKDGTANLLDEYALDPKVFYVNQGNLGVSAARNAGAKDAKGDWILFLDADDILLPKALEKISKFTFDSKLSLIRGGFIREKQDSFKKTIPDGKSYISPLVGSFCIRKSVFFKIGGYDERMKFSENTELLHRLVLENVNIAYIPEALFIYREYYSSGSRNLKNSIESIELLLTKHKGTLSSHSKYTFNKVLGVSYLRRRDFKNARRSFLIAFRRKPWKVAVLIRYGISLIPVLATNLYKSDL